LKEASVSHSASSLRNLAIILTACEPSNPLELWHKFRDALAEDFLHAHWQSINNPEAAINSHIYNKTLCALENVVIKIGGHPLADYSLPSPDHTAEQTMAREYQQEISYDPEEMAALAEQLESSLTQDQQQVFKAFHTMVQQGRDTSGNNIMFLDAPGGTGKTYLTNLLLAKIRSRGEIVLATASSGIAATLLQGGRTFHSIFKIPLTRGRVPLRQTALLQQSSVRPKPLSSTRLQ
jgi:tRNA(Met) C34 N-acetyltransferase TmcA